MLESTDIMIGRIAASSGMITEGKLDELVSVLRNNDVSKPVEEMLIDDGTLTDEQAAVLRRLRADIRSGRGVETGMFGQVAVEHGFVTAAQLERAKIRQVDLERRGEVRQLGEVMVEMGFITPHQIARILERQRKKPMMCGVCSKTYQILPGTEEKARCPTCAVKLVTQEEAEKVISPAEATAIIETVSAEPVQQDEKTPEKLYGQVIAGCEIIDKIGKGSMATVYRGRHLALGRVVAIKVLPAGGKGQLLVRRLLFEARAIAKLRDENIVQVYDAGLGKGHLFLVMEYVDGRPLDDVIIEAGQVMEERAIQLTREILKGLKAAHSAGIIHRDLKPANIMVDQAGHAKIMDFGLALDQEKTDEVEGMIVGTPYYMAPEQWLGQKADERTDLYATGFIFYVMLTGKKPFDSKTVSELMHMHLKQAPTTPLRHRPTLNKKLVAVLKKAMSKRPANRYQNADEFLNDLRRIEAGEDPEALGQFGKSVKCGFCEAMNPEGSTLCSVCSEPIAAKKQSLAFAARENEFPCPACKEFVVKGSRSCSHCTRPFCRRCFRKIAVQGGFCKGCIEQQGGAPPAARRKRR